MRMMQEKKDPSLKDSASMSTYSKVDTFKNKLSHYGKSEYNEKPSVESVIASKDKIDIDLKNAQELKTFLYN